MHSADRKLCALFRRMATSTSTSQAVCQTHGPLIASKASSHDDFAVSADKIDCERGALGREFLPRSSQPITTCRRLLRFAGLLSLVLLVQRIWPLPGLLQGWESENVVGLDDFCPQVEPLTPPGHEALLKSLDEEYGSSEFKLKAYESLGGAVRIP